MAAAENGNANANGGGDAGKRMQAELLGRAGGWLLDSMQEADAETEKESENDGAKLASGQLPSPPSPPPLLPMPIAAPMPTASFSQNIFYQAVGFLIGLFMAMATMYPMSRLTKAIVEEKETRMQETLLMMGLAPEVLVASWFVSALDTFTLTVGGICHVLTHSFL